MFPQIFVRFRGRSYDGEVRASLFSHDLEHFGQSRDQAGEAMTTWCASLAKMLLLPAMACKVSFEMLASVTLRKSIIAKNVGSKLGCDRMVRECCTNSSLRYIPQKCRVGQALLDIDRESYRPLTTGEYGAGNLGHGAARGPAHIAGWFANQDFFEAAEFAAGLPPAAMREFGTSSCRESKSTAMPTADLGAACSTLTTRPLR